MWPSRNRPGHSDGVDNAFDSDDARVDESPSADTRVSRFGRRSDARRGPVESSSPAEPVTGAAPASSPLSAFATGRSFDPPESGSAADLEKKPGRERPKRSLKMRAIGYLSRREHSRTELERKLKPFVEEGDSIEDVLNALEREGWLSDQRFAESVVHRRSGRFGASRIIGELKRNAVDSELVSQVAGELRDSERSRAYAVWTKKFSSLPTTPAERAKQARFLASRGFSSAAITAVLKGGEWLEEAGGEFPGD
jgi:regulatory protein